MKICDRCGHQLVDVGETNEYVLIFKKNDEFSAPLIFATADLCRECRDITIRKSNGAMEGLKKLEDPERKI